MSQIHCANGTHSLEIQLAIIDHHPAPHFPGVTEEELYIHVRHCLWCQGLLDEDGQPDCFEGFLSAAMVRTNFWLALDSLQRETFWTEDYALLNALQDHINGCPHCQKAKTEDQLIQLTLRHFAQKEGVWSQFKYKTTIWYFKVRRLLLKAFRS